MNYNTERRLFSGGVIAMTVLAAIAAAGFLAPESAVRWIVLAGVVLVGGILTAFVRIFQKGEKEPRGGQLDENLAVAERLREQLYEANPFPVLFIGLTGEVTFINPAGRHLADVVGLDTNAGHWNLADFWPSPGQADAVAALDAARAGGTETFRSTFVAVTGATIALDWTLSAGPDALGGAAEIMCVARDVSEESSADEKFRVMFENSTTACFLFDGEVIVDCNHMAVEIMGCASKDELLSKRVDDLSPEFQPDGIASAAGREECWALAREVGYHCYEWLIERCGAGAFPVEITLSPIASNGRNLLLASWKDLSERRNAELALKDSEERFIAFMNHSPTLCFIKDDQGRIVFINDVMAKAFNTSQEEMYGKNDFDWLPLESARAVMDYDRRILESGKASQQTEVVTTGDGREYEWLVVKFPIIGPDRRMLGGIGVDIREQRKAERALKLSEAHFRDLFDDAPVAYHELNTAGRITRVNKTERALLGYGEREMEGRTLQDFIVEEEVCKTIAAKLGGKAKLGDGYQCTFRRKDGSLVPVLVMERLITDPSGRVSGLRCTMQDITALKQAAQEIRIAEEKYRKIFENAIEGIFQSSPDGRYLNANPALAAIFGFSSPEELMNTVSDIGAQGYVEPDRRDELVKLLEKNGSVADFESRMYRKDGSIIWISEHARCVRDEEGNVAYFEGAIEDVSARKEAGQAMATARDAALESARLKGEFLANMSHEIRTPMNGIIGMTGLLLDMDMSQRQRDFTQTIADSADALLKIINDILDFSKIEAGMMSFEEIEFDLHEVVEGVVDLFAGRALVKRLEVASIVGHGLSGRLRGDPGRLRQVLANLVGNAVKFTETGHVFVEVETISASDDDAFLRFTVSDTGIGISEEQASKLFQAFVQADGSTTRRHGGTGLGLAISKRLVGQMGGEIGLRSAESGGSAFWFTARFLRAPSSDSFVDDAALFAGARALIVDDCEPTRKSLAHLLNHWGMQTVSVHNCREAVALLSAEVSDGRAFDISLVSMRTGDTDGRELTQVMKSDSRFTAMPVLALTVLESAEEVAMGACGPDESVCKPVKRTALRSAVARLIGAGLVRESAPTIRKSAPKPEATRKESHLRILVAEDSLVNQKVVSHQLEKLGHRVDIEANGDAALAATERTEYAVILMDCQMPGKDGYEATREIRKRETLSGRRVWIIAMTAHAMVGSRERCIEAGMDDYIAKPVRIEELAAALGRYESLCDSTTGRLAWRGAVDSEAIDGFRELEAEMGQSVLPGLVRLFLENTPAVISGARAAVSAGDGRILAREAHMLKGSCANFGATRMRNACDRLEHLARAGEMDHAAELLGEIEREYDYVRIALEHEIGGVTV